MTVLLEDGSMIYLVEDGSHFRWFNGFSSLLLIVFSVADGQMVLCVMGVTYFVIIWGL